jgi:hypothetical protein
MFAANDWNAEIWEKPRRYGKNQKKRGDMGKSLI